MRDCVVVFAVALLAGCQNPSSASDAAIVDADGGGTLDGSIGDLGASVPDLSGLVCTLSNAPQASTGLYGGIQVSPGNFYAGFADATHYTPQMFTCPSGPAPVTFGSCTYSWAPQGRSSPAESC